MQATSPTTGVLTNATPRQLEQAIVQNHTELFTLSVMVSGGQVYTKNGVTCTYGSNNYIAFPELTEANAGAILNDIMAWYHSQPPECVGYWSVHPPRPANLDLLLLARGFQSGWRPNWMVLDLTKMKEDHPIPANLQIVPDNTTSTQYLKDLPYSGDNGAVSLALLKQHPGKAQRFIATLEGNIVGQSAVLLTSGALGVGGMYNVGVVPGARHKGIGKAVVLAACRYAREKGYQYMTLNGTGREMYEQVGFKQSGFGFTWWLKKEIYYPNPPTARQVALAEAIGQSDLTGLERIGKEYTMEELNTPLANGMTLLGLAAHFRKYATAEWLLAQGVSCTALDAWNLGWKEKTRQVLAADPQEVNRRYPDIAQTLLHIAAERNDLALAELALEFHPDLSLTDSVYNGTPLGWAMHFNRQPMIGLIQKYSATLNP